MSKILSAVFCLLFAVVARADLFSSPEAFVEQAKTYDFHSDPYKLGFYLSIEEPHQPEEHPKIIAPEKTEDAGLLWKSNDRAMVFITARPNTESTPSETGMLVALMSFGPGWAIGDKVPVRAVGKYAKVTFKFTGGDHEPPPVVTITTINGGRGASYEASSSYELVDGRLVRKEL